MSRKFDKILGTRHDRSGDYFSMLPKRHRKAAADILKGFVDKLGGRDKVPQHLWPQLVVNARIAAPYGSASAWGKAMRRRKGWLGQNRALAEKGISVREHALHALSMIGKRRQNTRTGITHTGQW